MKLAEGVEVYIQRKRDGGLLYKTSGRVFIRLAQQLGDIELNQVCPRDILRLLNGPNTSPITWQINYRILMHFFEFWRSRGVVKALVMPPPKPRVRSAFTPYVYSSQQIRAILRATTKSQTHRCCVIAANTLRIFLLTMYGTGASLGELLDLRVADLVLKKGTLQLKGGRHGRSREIPICQDLQRELRLYLKWRSKNKVVTDHLFLKADGRPLVTGTLNHNFRALLSLANIRRNDGAKSLPRMRDMRHTFAVHRITAWIRNGADLNRMLPALAAYMGQAELGSAEQYLWMAPERFRKELNKLSPTTRKRHWRDDKTLMGFIATL